MAIGQGFHAKPSPTLGSLPAGLNTQKKQQITNIGDNKMLTEVSKHCARLYRYKMAPDCPVNNGMSCQGLFWGNKIYNLFSGPHNSCRFLLCLQKNGTPDQMPRAKLCERPGGVSHEFVMLKAVLSGAGVHLKRRTDVFFSLLFMASNLRNLSGVWGWFQHFLQLRNPRLWP